MADLAPIKRRAALADGWSARYDRLTMGSAKRGIALVVGVGTLGLFVAPAQAGQRAGPLAHAACDVAPCTVPDNITAPPKGSAIETLPVPAAVGAVILVTPFKPKPNPDDVSAFDRLQATLSAKPNTRARIHTCIDVTIHILVRPVYGQVGDKFIEQDAPLAALFMAMCLQVVKSLQNSGAATAAAAGSCPQLALNVGVQVTRAGRGYRVQTTGLLKPARGLPGVKVSCRRLRTGTGYQISVTPARRGQKLARALGPKMQIGFENGSNRSVPVHTAVAFR